MGRLIPLLLVLAVAGCNGGNESNRAVEVPNLIGLQYRPATELLESRRLAWRYAGTDEVHRRGLPDNVHSTADDNFIVVQEPDPGEPVEPGAVIVIETSCSMDPLPEGAICID